MRLTAAITPNAYELLAHNWGDTFTWPGRSKYALGKRHKDSKKSNDMKSSGANKKFRFNMKLEHWVITNVISRRINICTKKKSSVSVSGKATMLKPNFAGDKWLVPRIEDRTLRP